MNRKRWGVLAERAVRQKLATARMRGMAMRLLIRDV